MNAKKLLLIAVFALVLSFSQALAFEMGAQWNNGDQENSIAFGQEADYMIYANPLVNAHTIRSEVLLIDAATSAVLKTIHDEETLTSSFTGYFIVDDLSVTLQDYENHGQYFLQVRITQLLGSNQMSDSTFLQLTVNPISDTNINADFEFNPHNPVEGEVVTFTSTSTSDFEINSFVWTHNGQVIGNQEQITYAFQTPGTKEVTLQVQDIAGGSDEVTKSIVVLEDILPPPVGPTASFTYSPLNPVANEEVTFTSTSIAGDSDIVSYEWFINGTLVSTSLEFDYVFSQPGTYEVTLVVVDENGLTSEFTKIIVVEQQAFVGPTANFVFSTSNPEVGEGVVFTSTAQQGDSEIVLRSWFVDGQMIGQGSFITYVFDEEGTYSVRHFVRDENDLTDSITKQIQVTQEEQGIVIDELGCLANVVQGQNQHCSAHVSNLQEQDVQGAQVTFYLEQDNSVLGTCTTNFKGYCSIFPTITLDEGLYEVYAYASFENLEDNSGLLRSTFQVWTSRYLILELALYEDFFQTLRSIFYRGETVYSQFKVRDTFTNQIMPVTSGLVSAMTLKVNNEAELNLQSLPVTSNEFFRFRLDSIPLTDDFLGEGAVYAFVFNFTDGTAGQTSAQIEILNNPLEFNLPSEIEFEQGETLIIDFKEFVEDVETPKEEVVFTFENLQNFQLTAQGNNVFSITAPNEHLTETLTVTADDTDGSTVTRSIILRTAEIVVLDPVAVLNVKGTVDIGEKVLLDGTQSFAREGVITNYEFVVTRNGEFIADYSSSTAVAEHTFTNNGRYEVTLTITDNEGRIDSDQKLVFVQRSRANASDIVIGDFEGLHISNIKIAGSDDLTISLGEPVWVYATITNNRDHSIDNLRMSFTLPEFGLRVNGQSFSLRPGQSIERSMIVELPPEAYYFDNYDVIANVGVHGSGFSRNKFVPLVMN